MTKLIDANLIDDTDAARWAREFIDMHAGKFIKPNGQVGEIDEGLMITWFANAIETGRRAGERKYYDPVEGVYLYPEEEGKPDPKTDRFYNLNGPKDEYRNHSESGGHRISW